MKRSIYIDMTLIKKNKKIRINLVNTAGAHDNPDVFTIDETPKIGPIEIIVEFDAKPAKIMIEPIGITTG